MLDWLQKGPDANPPLTQSSSTVASRVGGIVKPSILAVLLVLSLAEWLPTAGVR
jgi:hypothetical protein